MNRLQVLDQRPPDSPPRGRTVMGELQTLLSSLLGLYSQVSSRLLSSRMSTQQGPATPREGIPIGDLLDHHIEQTAAAARQSRSAASDEAASATPAAPESRSIAAAGKAGLRRSGSGIFSALSSQRSARSTLSA